MGFARDRNHGRARRSSCERITSPVRPLFAKSAAIQVKRTRSPLTISASSRASSGKLTSKAGGSIANPRGSGNRDTEAGRIVLFRAKRITGWQRHMRNLGSRILFFHARTLPSLSAAASGHRHNGCKFSYTSKSRMEFWLPKFEQNIARDRLVARTLREAGWRVVRVWECQLARKKQTRVLRRLKTVLVSR